MKQGLYKLILIIGLMLIVVTVQGAFALNLRDTSWIKNNAKIDGSRISQMLYDLDEHKVAKPDIDCSGADKLLQWTGSSWVCATYESPQCRVGYKLFSDTNESSWVYTPWAKFGDNSWYDGDSASVSPNVMSFADYWTQVWPLWISGDYQAAQELYNTYWNSQHNVKAILKLECKGAPVSQRLMYNIDINSDSFNDGSKYTTYVDDGNVTGSIDTTRSAHNIQYLIFKTSFEESQHRICHISYKSGVNGGSWSDWGQDGAVAKSGSVSSATIVNLKVGISCGKPQMRLPMPNLNYGGGGSYGGGYGGGDGYDPANTIQDRSFNFGGPDGTGHESHGNWD